MTQFTEAYMGQTMKVRLSCYLALLSLDSKPGKKTAKSLWLDPYVSPGIKVIKELHRENMTTAESRNDNHFKDPFN